MPTIPTLHLTDWQIAEAALRRAKEDSRRPRRDPRNAVVARGSWGGHGSDEDDPDEGKAVGA